MQDIDSLSPHSTNVAHEQTALYHLGLLIEILTFISCSTHTKMKCIYLRDILCSGLCGDLSGEEIQKGGNICYIQVIHFAGQ